MLSGETAMGVDPARVVRVMAKIAERAEQDAFEMDAYRGIGHDLDSSEVTNAICEAACVTARDIGAKAIIAVTTSGYTARRMSKFRPETPVIAATPLEKTYHQLSLSWGVYPVLALYQSTSDGLFRHAVDCARMTDMIRENDIVVITGGAPLGAAGNTNLLKVHKVEDVR
jgi:pyruvate kinase